MILALLIVIAVLLAALLGLQIAAFVRLGSSGPVAQHRQLIHASLARTPAEFQHLEANGLDGPSEE